MYITLEQVLAILTFIVVVVKCIIDIISFFDKRK